MLLTVIFGKPLIGREWRKSTPVRRIEASDRDSGWRVRRGKSKGAVSLGSMIGNNFVSCGKYHCK